MQIYQYRAFNRSGEAVRGEIAGTDRAGAIASLQGQGLIPLSAELRRSSTIDRLFRRRVITAARLPARELADLFDQLAALAEAGVAIEQALTIAMQRAGAPRVRRVVQELHHRLRAGMGLANAMKASTARFPPIAIVMVSTGEAAGDLQTALSRLAGYLRYSEEIRQSIVSSLVYPCFLLITVFLSVGLILTVVIPQLEPLFAQSKTELPLATRLVLEASWSLRNLWWVMVPALLAVTIGCRSVLAQPSIVQWRDRLVLRLPKIGATILRAQIASFARTLGVLVWAQVPLPTALSLASGVLSNTAISGDVARALAQVREGSSLANALARTSVFPEPSIQLMRIGEATGALDAMLTKLADLFDRDVRQMVARAMALFVPILTIAFGVVVAGIIGSVMIAVLSVNDLAM